MNPHRSGEAHELVNAGTIQYEAGNIQAAERLYRRALEIDNRFAMAHFDLANCLDDSGKLQEAAEHYRTALQLAPAYPEPHFNLALVYCKLGDRRALQHWQAYVRLEPNHPDANHARAEITRLLRRSGLTIVASKRTPKRTGRPENTARLFIVPPQPNPAPAPRARRSPTTTAAQIDLFKGDICTAL